MTVHQTQFDRQAHHYAAVKARLTGEPKRVMIRVDMRHAAPIKPVRLKASTRDQQNEFIKHRCQQLRVCCKTITAERLSPRVKTIRDQILMEVKERWPNAHAIALASCNRKANSIRDLLATLKPKSPRARRIEIVQSRHIPFTTSRFRAGLEASPNDILQHLAVHRQVRNDLLQSRILVLELLQLPYLRWQQTSIFLLPVEVGRVADPLLAADLRNPPPSSPCFRMNAFCASENCDAFIVFRSFPSQEKSPENSNRSSLKGSDHTAKAQLFVR